MTILFLDQFNQPGGAQQCLIDVIAGILSRGWRAVVMLPGEGFLGEQLRTMGVEVIPVACGPYASGHKTFWDLIRFIRDVAKATRQIADCRKRYGAQIVYVNGPRLIPAALLGRGRARLVFHCHSLLSPRYLEWTTALPLWFAKAWVIASSQFVAVPLLRYVASRHLSVIYNGVPLTSVHSPCHSGFRVGVIGRVAPEKGQDVFLRAARIIQQDTSGCTFVVCGAPLFSDPAYEVGVMQLSAGLPVEFTGWVGNVGPVLSGLDLLVVPSTAVDATPRIILEAFAARVPVVAFANAGFRELIEDGRTGFLVESRTPEGLAETILDILKSETREDVVEAAFCEWRKRFSLDAYKENILNVLDQMC